MEIQPLNDNACNHEETRAALKIANANFEVLRAAVEQLVKDFEALKQSTVRPT
jgi:hypothetical protein